MNPEKIAEASRWLSILTQLYTAEMADLLAPFGLTPTQFGILNHLCAPTRAEGQRISQIAAAVQAGQPAVTKIMAKFEGMGLVTTRPDSHDRRAHMVIATDRARSRLREIQQAMADRLGALWSVLPDERIAPLVADMKALAARLDSHRPER